MGQRYFCPAEYTTKTKPKPKPNPKKITKFRVRVRVSFLVSFRFCLRGVLRWANISLAHFVSSYPLLFSARLFFLSDTVEPPVNHHLSGLGGRLWEVVAYGKFN